MSVVDVIVRNGFWWTKLEYWRPFNLWGICVTNDHVYLSLVISTYRSFPHSWHITGFVSRLTRRVSLVKQELPTLPEHLSSTSVFSRVRVTRSLVFCVMFCRSLFVLLSFFVWPLCCLSFDVQILITSLWYLQTLLYECLFWNSFFCFFVNGCKVRKLLHNILDTGYTDYESTM